MWGCRHMGRYVRAVFQAKKKKKRVRTANRNECPWGHSLLHGQDMGETQNHRSMFEQ